MAGRERAATSTPFRLAQEASFPPAPLSQIHCDDHPEEEGDGMGDDGRFDGLSPEQIAAAAIELAPRPNADGAELASIADGEAP